MLEGLMLGKSQQPPVLAHELQTYLDAIIERDLYHQWCRAPREFAEQLVPVLGDQSWPLVASYRVLDDLRL